MAGTGIPPPMAAVMRARSIRNLALPNFAIWATTILSSPSVTLKSRLLPPSGSGSMRTPMKPAVSRRDRKVSSMDSFTHVVEIRPLARSVLLCRDSLGLTCFRSLNSLSNLIDQRFVGPHPIAPGRKYNYGDLELSKILLAR